MTLFTVLLNLNQFPEQHSLYVQRPWTLESETLVQSPSSINNTLNILNPKISAYKTAVSASLNLLYKHLSKS